METKASSGTSSAVLTRADRYYPPSWVDGLTAWVNRLPAPAWLSYLILWLLLIFITSVSKWLDGVEPSLKIRWIYVIYPFYGVYFLAAIHYLDVWARIAFENFRPALVVDDAEESLLFHQLTNLPTRPVWLLSAASLVGLLALYRPLFIPLWEAIGFNHQTTAAMLVDLGIYLFNLLMVAIFVYHTLRQMRWISRIHQTATRLNLFQLRPAYALSGLTARTAGVLLLVGTIIWLSGNVFERQSVIPGSFAPRLSALQVSSVFSLVSIIVYSVLAVGVFILPLLGLHQLLLREKERLLAEAESRLQAHIQELHHRIDNHELANADAMNYHLSSLSLERDILHKLPTWPWLPGTLNVVLSAVLLPIILWIIQQVLERWVGL